MKRFVSALVAPLLIALLLITTSFNFGSVTQGKVFICLGDVGFQILAKGEERLTFSKLLESSGSGCLDAALAP